MISSALTERLTQHVRTLLPGTRAFVFGSSVTRPRFRDIDIV